MAGVFPPLLTDENVDGPLIDGLRARGWDVVRSIDVVGKSAQDTRIFEHAAHEGRVLVTGDQDHLVLGTVWAREGRPFRMVFLEQPTIEKILVSPVLDAFEELATRPNLFACPIEYLKIDP